MPHKDQENKRAYHAAYRATHHEEAAAYRASHREEKCDERRAYAVTYQTEHPEKRREYKATRRARKTDAFIEAIDRQTVFSRDAGLCGICQQGVEAANWHLDHIQPLSKGGQHSYDNVQVSHPVCNLRKGASYGT